MGFVYPSARSNRTARSRSVSSGHTAGAVAYDEAGRIIGGGDVLDGPVPAGGELALEILIAVGSQPARIELYPALISLLDVS